MTDHTVSVASAFLEDGWWGECTCGWRGSVRAVTTMALADARCHEDALRAREVNDLLWDDLEGARIDHVERRPDGKVVVCFGHRGTDDGAGYLIVDADAIHVVEEQVEHGANA